MSNNELFIKEQRKAAELLRASANFFSRSSRDAPCRMSLADASLELLLLQSLVPDNEVLIQAHHEIDQRKRSVAIVPQILAVLHHSQHEHV